MNKWTLLTVLFIALSWTALLFPWVSVETQTLTGAELSEIIALLPALAILMLLISLYGRGRNLLLASSSLTLAVVVVLSLTTNYESTPASIALQESISGIAGESSLATRNGFYLLFAVLSSFAALSVAGLLFAKPQPKSRQHSKKDNDTRSLWEEQA
jgi:membrane-associated HD superfamily phosphohydrolase